jgi:hypothetical protein
MGCNSRVSCTNDDDGDEEEEDDDDDDDDDQDYDEDDDDDDDVPSMTTAMIVDLSMMMIYLSTLSVFSCDVHIIVMKLVSKDYPVLIGRQSGRKVGDNRDDVGDRDNRDDVSRFRDAVKVSFVTGRVFDCLSDESHGSTVGSEARLPVSYDDFLEVRSICCLVAYICVRLVDSDAVDDV